jgi:UDP-glucose 4-epimerase
VLEICEALKTAIEEPANSLENLGHGVGTTVNAMVEMYKEVNNVKFDVKYGPRRKGDAAVSVLDNPSRYMKHLFELKDLLKVSE